MKASLPLTIDRYFFTHQEVIALPDHAQEDDRIVNNSVDINLKFESNKPGVVVGECKVTSDDENCVNSPYTYKLNIVSFFNIIDDQALKANEEEFKKLCTPMITQFLVGIARERLHDLTSRSPWGPVLMDFFPLGNQISENNKPKKVNKKK